MDRLSEQMLGTYSCHLVGPRYNHQKPVCRKDVVRKRQHAVCEEQLRTCATFSVDASSWVAAHADEHPGPTITSKPSAIKLVTSFNALPGAQPESLQEKARSQPSRAGVPFKSSIAIGTAAAIFLPVFEGPSMGIK